jgi:hypothetical protein
MEFQMTIKTSDRSNEDLRIEQAAEMLRISAQTLMKKLDAGERYRFIMWLQNAALLLWIYRITGEGRRSASSHLSSRCVMRLMREASMNRDTISR